MIVKIARFTDRRLLLGTTENFQIFNPSDNHFLTYSYNKTKPEGISYSRVTDILVENDSTIWIGTPKGLNRFNPLTGSFKSFYEKDGLPDDFIKGITMDSSGFLWVTTGHGVCRIDCRNDIKRILPGKTACRATNFWKGVSLKPGTEIFTSEESKGLILFSPVKLLKTE